MLKTGSGRYIYKFEFFHLVSIWILTGGLILAMLCGCQKEATAPSAQAIEVTAVTVTPRTIPVILEYLGQTESSRLIEIRTRVEGVLIKRSFKEGDVVKEGDLLFQIDPRPLEAALEDKRGQLAIEEAKLINAQRNAFRLRPLFKQKAVSQKDLDDAISAEQQGRASVRAAKAKVQEAELNLGYTRITSPISGLVSRAIKADGNLVSPGQDSLLTTVAQLDPMYVNFTISDNELRKYHEQEEKKFIKFPEDDKLAVELVMVDGRVHPFIGRVSFAEPSFSPETGTLKLRAEVTNPKESGNILLPGQFVRVRLKGAVRPNVLLVPQRAVLQGQTGKMVYVLTKESKAELRDVEVGAWYEKEWVINSGLKDGDFVVVDGAIKLQPGAPAKAVPMDKKTEPADQAEKKS